MSSNHHTPIVYGANADDTVFNPPLSQLDQTLFDMIAGDLDFSGLAVAAPVLNSKAALQVDSTTKGFLPPRMSEAERDAIASVPEGLIVHNTDDNAPYSYDGSDWVSLFMGGGEVERIIAPTVFTADTDVEIAGIPQTYQDLILRIRAVGGNTGTQMLMRFNGASGASDYAWARTLVNTGFTGLSNGADQADSEVELIIPPNAAAGGGGGYYSDHIIYIRNYATAQRIYGEFEGASWNTTNSFVWGAFEWIKAEAITQINFLPGTSVNDLTGDYALYGVGPT
jgi:hypothetical protein